MQAFVVLEGHVVIIISRTGENPLLYHIARRLAKGNIPLSVLTESRYSKLATLRMEHLYLYNVHRFTDRGTILFHTSAPYLFDLGSVRLLVIYLLEVNKIFKNWI